MCDRVITPILILSVQSERKQTSDTSFTARLYILYAAHEYRSDVSDFWEHSLWTKSLSPTGTEHDAAPVASHC